MKTIIYSLLITVIFLALSGWTLLPTTDRGSIHHYGALNFTQRNSQNDAGSFEHASRVSVFGDSSRWVLHAVRPDSNIETLMIGPFTLGEFIPGCSSEDTVKFRFELAVAFDDTHIDSIRDFASEPLATSPTIFVPYEGIGQTRAGYTDRYFYSSTTRFQSNGWDDFVTHINLLQTGVAFIIRMIPMGASGVIVHDWSQFSDPIFLSYSMNVNAEDEFLDIGDSRIIFLDPSEVSGFHGLVLRGDWQRDWGRTERMWVSGVKNDTVRTWRQLTIPFQESQSSGSFIVGIQPTLLQQYPSLTWIANLYPGDPETIPCRGDTLTAYWRP